MIKVLIVDDSQTARVALRHILERDSDIIVVGEAVDAKQTMQMINRYEPHFVTMDIYLEHENGLDLTRTIMTEAPRPILVVTGINPNDPKLIYSALERGALDVFPKPPGPNQTEYEPYSAQLIRLVKTLSKVPVLHQRRSKESSLPLSGTAIPERISKGAAREKKIGLLLIGASTGGPPVVSHILERLPKPSPVPIIVVQHITKGFAKGFADWLRQSTGHRTVLVDKTMTIEAGTVYIASDDADLAFSSSRTVRPQHDPDPRGARPSIDRLFMTAADHCHTSIAALVLTGMGSDGTAGLARLREVDAVTLAQEPDTCAVDSMPQSALKCGAAQKSLTPEEVVTFLTRRLG